MYYEIWDLESGNLIGDFDTQDEALRLVREMLDTYGVDVAMTFALGEGDANGDSTAIAQGAELVELARALPIEVEASVKTSS